MVLISNSGQNVCRLPGEGLLGKPHAARGKTAQFIFRMQDLRWHLGNIPLPINSLRELSHDFKPKSSTSVLHCHQRFPTFTYFTMDANNILLKWPLPPHNMYPRNFNRSQWHLVNLCKDFFWRQLPGLLRQLNAQPGALCSRLFPSQGNMWKEQKMKVNPIFERHSHKPLLPFLACWYSSTENFESPLWNSLSKSNPVISSPHCTLQQSESQQQHPFHISVWNEDACNSRCTKGCFMKPNPNTTQPPIVHLFSRLKKQLGFEKWFGENMPEVNDYSISIKYHDTSSLCLVIAHGFPQSPCLVSSGYNGQFAEFAVNWSHVTTQYG